MKKTALQPLQKKTSADHATEELILQRQKLDNVIKGTHAGTWEWNVQTGETVFNERWAEIIGYSLSEISPVSIDTWVKFTHPDDLKLSQVLLQKHFNGETEFYECECRMRHKDGTYVWVLDRGKVLSWTQDGRPLLMFGSHLDITERKRSEDALRTQSRILNTIFESAPYILMLVNEEGRVENINRAGATFTNREKNDLLGLLGGEVFQCLNAFHGNGCGRNEECAHCPVRTKVTRTFLDGESIYNAEGSLTVLRDGRPVELNLLISTTLIHTPLGNKTLVSIVDVSELKRVEEALRKSESKFRSIIDSSPIPYALNDDKQQITYLNPAFTKVFGYDLGDIPTLAEWWVRAYPDAEYRNWVLETWQARIEKAKTQGTDFEPLEVSIHCKDGSVRIALVDAGLFGEVSLDTHLVILHDITDRKRAEEILRASEERFRSLVNSLGDVVYSLDTEGRHTGVFGDWVQKAGLTPEFFLGKTVGEIFGAASAAVHEKANALALKGQSVSYEWFVPSPQEALHYQTMVSPLRDANGAITGLVGVGRDITALKRVEAALRTSEDQLASALKMAYAGHWEYDVASDTFTFNDNFYGIFRMTAKEVGGYHMTSAEYARRFCHPDDVHYVSDEIMAALETTDPNYSNQLEHRILYADGQVGYITVRYFIHKDEAGRTVKLHGVNQNITERKQAEEELKRANEQLSLRLGEIERLQIELREQVIHDALTGLYNRRYLQDALPREFARAGREEYPISVIMLDMDKLKFLNDTYGHGAGDLALQALASCLKAFTRAGDIVCRYGGDEFNIVMSHVAGPEALTRVKAWQKYLEDRPIQVAEGIMFPVQFSAGIAWLPAHGRTPDEITRNADTALYRAKDGGRNCAVLYTVP